MHRLARIAAVALALAGCERAQEAITPELVPIAAPPAPATPGPARETVAPSPPPVDAFLGAPDAPVLERLRDARIVGLRRGLGGRSAAFRVELEDGSRGYWKPEQALGSADYRAEIAAYHLDRELGLGRVPPVVGRHVSLGRIEAVLADDPRRALIVAQDDGRVRGALIAWIDERLTPLTLGRGWERWIGTDPPPYVTPFQRVRGWAAQARGEVSADTSPEPELQAASAGDPDTSARVGELSDLILFDHLALNIDRWGGGQANVLTRGVGGPLVFLDQGAAFLEHRTSFEYMDLRLAALRRFRRSTIDSLRRFSLARFASRLTRETTGVVLTDRQLEAIEARRRAVLAHVDEVVRLDGERAWVE